MDFTPRAVTMKIKRKWPRPGGDEEPLWDSRGYQLADPRSGPEYHHAKNAIFVQSLERAACLVEQRNYAIRMWRKGLRPSLVRKGGLIIER